MSETNDGWRTMTQEERDRLEASQGKAFGRALSPEEIRRLADPANDPMLVDSSAYRNHGVVFGWPTHIKTA